MLNAIKDAIERLTVGYNVANEYFDSETEAAQKIGYIEGVLADVISELQEAADDAEKIRIGRRQVS